MHKSMRNQLILMELQLGIAVPPARFPHFVDININLWGTITLASLQMTKQPNNMLPLPPPPWSSIILILLPLLSAFLTLHLIYSRNNCNIKIPDMYSHLLKKTYRQWLMVMNHEIYISSPGNRECQLAITQQEKHNDWANSMGNILAFSCW